MLIPPLKGEGGRADLGFTRDRPLKMLKSATADLSCEAGWGLCHSGGRGLLYIIVRRGRSKAAPRWGHSSVGRALEWHSRGRGFDSPWLHHHPLKMLDFYVSDCSTHLSITHSMAPRATGMGASAGIPAGG